MLPAKLFPIDLAVLNKEPTPASAVAAEKSSFGCSASANDGEHQIPWQGGFIEWLIYMFLIVSGKKKVIKRSGI